jgi:hypothetical protein
MRNLAGNADCDRYIRDELTRCGIEIVEGERQRGEVPARLSGRLGPYTFTRAWRYWVVDGLVPLATAQRLYAHPVGRTDIRVAGHCGCPPPEHPWLKYIDADGVSIVHDPTGEQERDLLRMAERIPSVAESLRTDPLRFALDAASVATHIGVDTYHIDTELGLYVFAEEVRRG